MKVVRLYTGPDNRSHFEEIDLPFPPGADTTPPLNAPGVTFRRRLPGRPLDWHCAPRRQYVITLAGQAEYEVGDGTVRRLGPSDILLAEDLTGQGHLSRVVGDQPRVSVWIPLPS